MLAGMARLVDTGRFTSRLAFLRCAHIYEAASILGCGRLIDNGGGGRIVIIVASLGWDAGREIGSMALCIVQART